MYKISLFSVRNRHNLSNLITNSITSFAKDDRLDKEITINLSKENNELCIYYTDNGMGLSNAYRNNPDLILEQFEVIERTN